MMRIFMSWSGELSNEVAIIFSNWIKKVIQNVDTYVSSENLEKGTRWSVDIAKELDNSNFGILFITKDNINAPWINFEAGALSKAVSSAKVCPFLYDVKNLDLKNVPLLQFQTTIVNDKKDIYKLVKTINKSIDTPVENNILEETFEKWWPQLEQELEIVGTKYSTEANVEEPQISNKDSVIEILDEVLTLTRDQQKILHIPERILPYTYLYNFFDYYLERKNKSRILLTEELERLNIIYDIDYALQDIRLITQEDPRFSELKQFIDELLEKHNILLSLIKDELQIPRQGYQKLQKLQNQLFDF